MKKQILNKARPTVLATSISMLIFANPVSAQFADDAKDGISDLDQGTSSTDIPTLLQTIVNTLLFLVGATSAIMLVVAGLRFVFSAGDQQQAASARNTILYSIIGIIVAVLAWGIVNYVLGIVYDGDTSATGGQ